MDFPVQTLIRIIGLVLIVAAAAKIYELVDQEAYGKNLLKIATVVIFVSIIYLVLNPVETIINVFGLNR